MVGGGKPNRSEDQSGTKEEREQHAREVKAFLDANAPQRQLKPSRSDAADAISDVNTSNTVIDPPERAKYLRLLAAGVPLETRGSGDVGDDFTESEYYQYMAAIDKAHHTTGTGFIEVTKSADGFHLSEGNAEPAQHSHRTQTRGNPATNDWEPSTDGTFRTSSKPSRSESSS